MQIFALQYDKLNTEISCTQEADLRLQLSSIIPD